MINNRYRLDISSGFTPCFSSHRSHLEADGIIIVSHGRTLL